MAVEGARDAILAQLLGQFALGEDFGRGAAEQGAGGNEDHQQQGREGAVQVGCGWHCFCVVVICSVKKMGNIILMTLFYWNRLSDMDFSFSFCRYTLDRNEAKKFISCGTSSQ